MQGISVATPVNLLMRNPAMPGITQLVRSHSCGLGCRPGRHPAGASVIFQARADEPRRPSVASR